MYAANELVLKCSTLAPFKWNLINQHINCYDWIVCKAAYHSALTDNTKWKRKTEPTDDWLIQAQTFPVIMTAQNAYIVNGFWKLEALRKSYFDWTFHYIINIRMHLAGDGSKSFLFKLYLAFLVNRFSFGLDYAFQHVECKWRNQVAFGVYMQFHDSFFWQTWSDFQFYSNWQMMRDLAYHMTWKHFKLKWMQIWSQHFWIETLFLSFKWFTRWCFYSLNLPNLY